MSQLNDLLRHELELQRVATQLIKQGIYPSLDEAYKAVRAILLNAETITSPTKLKATERAINKAINEALTKGWSNYTKELTGIAIYDASYYAQLIGGYAGATLKEPGKKAISDFIESALMSLTSGKSPKVGVWAEFVRDNVESYSAQVNNLVKAGYVNNATVGQMTTAIRQFNQGLARQQAEALARTGLQHYSQQARNAMISDNLDIVAREYPVVTFDNRISSTCVSIGTKYANGWPVGKSPVGYPPYHYNCRTSIIAGLKGKGDPRDGLERPAIGSGENYESGDTYKGRRSSAKGEFDIERIEATTGFGTWLKRQDDAFVTDVLGKRRADLFLKGGLPIERLSDAYGRPLTLAELLERDRASFVKAGLVPRG
jgi:hypothetical protein